MTKICVQGLWHLGTVTAACLASLDYEVIGLDTDIRNVRNLNLGESPIFEPGLNEMIKDGIKNGNLRFTCNTKEAFSDAEIIWITYDTPINNEDKADFKYVLDQIKNILPDLKNNQLVLISSQIPIGSVRKLENFVKEIYRNKKIFFAYSPENLRLGKAIETFLKPDRIIVGIRSEKIKNFIKKILYPISNKIEWMSIESAEMTKHAINSFLASSISFANEIASICEVYGADAKEVERGLKSENRIGPGAYLSPGPPFSGGTLARDIDFLNQVAKEKFLTLPIIKSVKNSNNEHKKWIKKRLKENYVSLRSLPIAIWGLTYKPNTNTLRRSLLVELCDWLINEGANLKIFDPFIDCLPERWHGEITNCDNEFEALKNTKILILGTEWDKFKISAKNLLEFVEKNYLVIDQSGFLKKEISQMEIRYFAVGMPRKFEKK